nr:MAG TPA: hypothetical protein [Caudoviricetes sp.]
MEKKLCESTQNTLCSLARRRDVMSRPFPASSYIE